MKTKPHFPYFLSAIGTIVLFTMSLSSYLGPKENIIILIIFILVVAAFGLIIGLFFKNLRLALIALACVIVLSGLGTLPEKSIGQVLLGSLGGAMYCLPFFGIGAFIRFLATRRHYQFPHTDFLTNSWLVLSIPVLTTVANFTLHGLLPKPATSSLKMDTLIWHAYELNKYTTLLGCLDIWTILIWTATIIWLLLVFVRKKSFKYTKSAF